MGRRALCLLVVAFAVASCSRSSAGTNKTTASTAAAGNATVERVVDGDTIIVHVGGRRERVRFIGIDTPESVKPNTPVQCFAIEASNRTKSLLPAGTPVRLV